MRYGFISMAAVLAVASTSFGAVMWSTPSGSTSNYSYTNGQDSSGGFGNGLTDSTGFYFTPIGFLSSSTNGGTNSISDTASVDLTAAAGKTFSSISGAIYGDFTIDGVGTTSATGSLTVTNLDTLVPVTLPLTIAGQPAASATSADGLFAGIANLSLPAGWSRIRIQLNDAMSSSAGVNSSSLVQTAMAEIRVTTGVPEPTSMLGLAGLAALARRTRRA